jgi:hypothetical protein
MTTETHCPPVEATRANLRQLALSEVTAFRLINGEPGLVDIPHLMTRVRVQIEPGFSDLDIEADVLFATSQDPK